MPASTATITPIPLPFSQLRSASHRALFLTTTETRQAVYIYDHERRETALAYELIPAIVLNGEQGPLLDPSQMPIANLYDDYRNSPWSTLSPDGTAIAVLQSLRDGLPNYIHQVDLISGQVTSMLILDDYQWTIPMVPGRTPEMGPYDPEEVTIRDEASTALRGFKWAPDGKGFLLEMRWIRDLFSDGFQLYYVPRASAEAIPLARQTAGIAVGEGALWSPDSRRILYEGNFLDRAEGIWMIDLEQPDRAQKLTDLVIDLSFDAFWAADGTSFFYETEIDGSGGSTGEALVQVNVLDGQTTEILRAVPTGQEEARLGSPGQLPLSGDLLILETHWLPRNPSTPDALPVNLPELTKTYVIRSGAVVELRLLGLDDLSAIRPSPADDWILVEYGAAMVCGIVSLPDEEIIYGPDEQVCGGSEWSPDGHLILGQNTDGDFTVFDLDTLEQSLVPPELDWTTTDLLGWVAEPSVFDELLARRDVSGLATPPTSTVTASPTARPTPTSKPLATPTPRTPVPPSATPSPELAWSPDVQIVAQIDAEQAEWSPRAPELALAQCVWTDTSRDGLYLARAPTFAPQRISPSSAHCVLEGITPFQLMWRPDGARLAFSGLSLKPGDEWMAEHVSWMDRSGGSIRTFEAAGRAMTLVGWMDDHTLVYQTYGGGGTWDAGLLDTTSGREELFPYRVAGAYPPSDRLIPIDDVYGFPSGRRPARAFFRDGRDITFPQSQTFASSGVTRFEDWFPDGHTMLVLAWEAGKALESDDPQTALEMWDTTAEAMTTLVPGGLHGRVSPNGRLLALLAPHPLVVRADGLVQGVDRDRQGAMLYLLEISARRVLFSIETSGPTDPMLEQWGGQRPDLLAWSPDSRRLVFYDAAQQVVLLDVESQHLTLITLSGGQTLGVLGWSFDGGYLSLTRPAGRSSETGDVLPGLTFVLVAP